jgi:transcriptional regulator with XRE-family HTH domain
MPTLREKLGRAVRRLRSAAGFSQERFADACRLHRTYIGSIERGETNISLDNIERIAQTLTLSVSALFVEAESEAESEG